LHKGVHAAVGARSLQKVADETSAAVNNSGTVQLYGVQHPADIVNYRSMGSTPALLAGALGLGAFFALGLTLLASVRKRRRELAILKTLGFTKRQLAAVVTWQSMVAVSLGTAVGVPLGIIVGRLLWTVFANQIYAVPRPTVSAASVVLVAASSLGLAFVIAIFPGLRAGRTPTSTVLRSE
jgi:ABC-type antimicrobial peptide transport system permease subunit